MAASLYSISVNGGAEAPPPVQASDDGSKAEYSLLGTTFLHITCQL